MALSFVSREQNAHKVYQVIPHRSVLNSQNRRLWAVMHELMQMYAPLSTRVVRDGYTAQVRDKDDVWWVVRMEYTDTPRIQFFVAVTDTFDETFRMRLANHEQWRHVTLSEAQGDALQLHERRIAVSELRLLRDNMFSLACNYTEQTSPIRNLLDVTNQLKPGDTVQVMIRLECITRMKWRRLSDYSWKRWNAGRVPKRNRIKPQDAARSVGSVAAKAINEGMSIAESTLRAVEKSFFAGETSDIAIGRIEMIDLERQQLLVNGDLSKDTKGKANHAAFKASIRLLVASDDDVRRDMLTQSLAASYAELSGDNRLELCRATKGALDECMSLHYHTLDRDPVILSVDEVGKLVQLPTQELQDEYRDAMQSNRTAEVEIPTPFRDASGIYMGDVTHKGDSFPVYLPTQDRDMLFTPRAFVAAPRSGKDMAIVNFVVEAKRKHGIGSVILDAIDERGQRGMSDSVRDALDPADVIDLNLGDFEHPVYLGLQGITSSQNKRIMTNRIAQELTNFLIGDEPDGLRMQDYLFACAQLANADPVMIRAILTNPDIREKALQDATNEDAADTMQQFHAMSPNMQNQIAGPVLTRLGKIMRDEFLKPIFGQRYNPKVGFARWMREGKVIIVRVPSRDLGQMAVKTIMHWLTLVVFLTKLGGCGGETFLVLNEPHQYETPGWLQFVERMLLEGPKYRIAPFFAFHLFSKLSRQFVSTLMASGVNWHIGNNSSLEVFKQLADVLQPTFTPEEAKEQIRRYHFIAAWRDTMGEYQTPFIYKAPDLVHNRYKTRDNGELTARHSAMYGRPTADILSDIRTRQKAP